MNFKEQDSAVELEDVSNDDAEEDENESAVSKGRKKPTIVLDEEAAGKPHKGREVPQVTDDPAQVLQLTDEAEEKLKRKKAKKNKRDKAALTASAEEEQPADEQGKKKKKKTKDKVVEVSQPSEPKVQRPVRTAAAKGTQVSFLFVS